MKISMDDFYSFQTESDGFPRRSFILYVLSTVTTATAGRTAVSSVQAILPSVIIVTVFSDHSRIVVKVSRLPSVVGVARIAADGDQTDIAGTGVAVRPIVVTTIVAAVIPTVPHTVIATARRTTAAATVRIVHADIAVAIATDTLETEGTAVITTGVMTAGVATATDTVQKIPKTVAGATARIGAATVAGKTVRITSIAHSVSILLVYFLFEGKPHSTIYVLALFFVFIVSAAAEKFRGGALPAF